MSYLDILFPKIIWIASYVTVTMICYDSWVLVCHMIPYIFSFICKKIYLNIFIFLTRQSGELCLTANASRVRRKVGNGRKLMRTKCLNRFPGSLCLPCFMQDTAWSYKKILLILIWLTAYIPSTFNLIRRCRGTKHKSWGKLQVWTFGNC